MVSVIHGQRRGPALHELLQNQTVALRGRARPQNWGIDGGMELRRRCNLPDRSNGIRPIFVVGRRGRRQMQPTSARIKEEALGNFNI